QGVDVVVVAKTLSGELRESTIRHMAAHPFASAQSFRHHVRLQNVWPAVIVEIGDIDAHAGKTRMLEPLAGFIRKRSIPVVDIKDVVGRDVVRDVDVGPPVSIDVADDDAESVPELSQYPPFPGDIRECAVTVVAVELIVAAGAPAACGRRVDGGFTAVEILGRVVEQKQVEESVSVVVEEDGMRREPGVGDTVL